MSETAETCANRPQSAPQSQQPEQQTAPDSSMVTVDESAPPAERVTTTTTTTLTTTPITTPTETLNGDGASPPPTKRRRKPDGIAFNEKKLPNSLSFTQMFPPSAKSIVRVTQQVVDDGMDTDAMMGFASDEHLSAIDSLGAEPAISDQESVLSADNGDLFDRDEKSTVLSNGSASSGHISPTMMTADLMTNRLQGITEQLLLPPTAPRDDNGFQMPAPKQPAKHPAVQRLRTGSAGCARTRSISSYRLTFRRWQAGVSQPRLRRIGSSNRSLQSPPKPVRLSSTPR